MNRCLAKIFLEISINKPFGYVARSKYPKKIICKAVKFPSQSVTDAFYKADSINSLFKGFFKDRICLAHPK